MQWSPSKLARKPLEQNPSRRGNSCRACRVDLSGGRASTYRLVAPAYRHVAPTLKPCVFRFPGTSRHLPGPSRRPKTVQKTSFCWKSSLWCLGAVAICFFDFTSDLLLLYLISSTLLQRLYSKDEDLMAISNIIKLFVQTVAIHYMIQKVFASSYFLNSDSSSHLPCLFVESHTCSHKRDISKPRLCPSFWHFRWQCQQRKGHLKTVKGAWKLPYHLQETIGVFAISLINLGP